MKKSKEELEKDQREFDAAPFIEFNTKNYFKILKFLILKLYTSPAMYIAHLLVCVSNFLYLYYKDGLTVEMSLFVTAFWILFIPIWLPPFLLVGWILLLMSKQGGLKRWGLLKNI